MNGRLLRLVVSLGFSVNGGQVLCKLRYRLLLFRGHLFHQLSDVLELLTGDELIGLFVGHALMVPRARIFR